MEKIFQYSFCYDIVKGDMTLFSKAPFDITVINKGVIHASGKVFERPDVKVKVNESDINKPYLEKKNKYLLANMWTIEDKLSENNLKRLTDFFADELTKAGFAIPESLCFLGKHQ